MLAARSLLLFALLAPACRDASPSVGDHVPREPLLVGDARDALQTFRRFLDLMQEGQLDSEQGRAVLAHDFDLGSALKPGERHDCDAVVRIDDTHAVARVVLIEPARENVAFQLGKDSLTLHAPEHAVDTYWYLDHTDAWRVTTWRALACTGLLEHLAWADLDPAELDRAQPGLSGMIENARLTLRSDRELGDWFRSHRAELDALAASARETVTANGNGVRRVMAAPDSSGAVAEELRRLHLSAVLVKDDGGLDLTVGGVTDNEVLFRFVPSDELPRISPDDVIWAERVAPGWFLLRTT